jgi:gamma-glutamyltranspeptidase / glutathione hydrolase
MIIYDFDKPDISLSFCFIKKTVTTNPVFLSKNVFSILICKIMNLFHKTLWIFVLLLAGQTGLYHTESYNYNPKGSETVFNHASVVSAHPVASHIGVEIMKKGGNAIDAAIAVQFALSVVYPGAGNIGGGGFMVIRMADGSVNTLDFREKAPASTFQNMYLDSADNVIQGMSTTGHMSSGVPGVVDGMVNAHKRYGKLKWKTLLEPAIALAQKGYVLTEKEADKLNTIQQSLLDQNTIVPEYLLKQKWQDGDTIWNMDYAHTLTRIKEKGRNGFYKGKTAQLILDEMDRGGGIITQKDLNAYRSVWRQPVIGSYKNYKVISMGPPSSGGILLIQILKMIEPFAIENMQWNSPEYVNLLVEAEKRAYADRAKYLGDPDKLYVPEGELTDSLYLLGRFSDFKPGKVIPSSKIFSGKVELQESDETTHFSIVDADGNAVSVTTTLNSGFGNKVVVGHAGFFLNNEMDDFSIKPGHPNIYGLVGGIANAIEPGKRMLSSMTPTIIEKDGKLFMIVGSPGGSKIITAVLQAFLNVTAFDLGMQEAVTAGRFHHQWLPDWIDYEKGALGKTVMQTLIKIGYELNAKNQFCRVDGILIKNDGKLETGADPRGDDFATGY